MQYKRDESFRYTCKTPIEGTFSLLITLEDKEVETSLGAMFIEDISPGGLKFSSTLDIPFEQKEVLVNVSYTLGETPLAYSGKLVWKKQLVVNYFTYGFEALEDEMIEEQVTTELKKLVRTQVGL